ATNFPEALCARSTDRSRLASRARPSRVLHPCHFPDERRQVLDHRRDLAVAELPVKAIALRARFFTRIGSAYSTGRYDASVPGSEPKAIREGLARTSTQSAITRVRSRMTRKVASILLPCAVKP